MAIIDLDRLAVEVLEIPRETLYASLDEQCQQLLGMSADEFLEAIRSGREIDHPSAPRLAILARALIGPG